MPHIIKLLMGIMSVYMGVLCIRDYMGKTGCAGQKEKHRQEKVNKIGTILIVFGVFCILFGLVSIIYALINMW